MAFTDKELGDERLSEVLGGRAMTGYIEHTVARGDTLARIAAQYHVTERELTDLNGMQSAGHLYIGQIIKVPVHIGM